MKDRNDRRWLIAGIVFFALMIFAISTAYADSNLNKTDGTIKANNLAIDFFNAFGGSGTFSLNGEYIYSDTLASEYMTADTLVADTINVRVVLADSVIVGLIHGDTLIFEYAEVDNLIVTDDIELESGNTISNPSADDIVYTGRLGSSYYQNLTDIATMDRQHILSGTAKLIGTDPFNSKTQMQGGFFAIQLGDGIEITESRSLIGSENKATLDRDMSDATSVVIGSYDKVSIRDTTIFAGSAIGNKSRLERSDTALSAKGYNYYAEKTAAGFTFSSILGTAANTWDYGIDLNDATISTAEIRGSNGETISNVVDGQVAISGIITNSALQTTTLGVGDITFAITSNIIQLTGDGGANVLGTITSAGVGIYTIIFVDGLITVTDTDVAAAGTIDLLGSSDLTSADDTTLTLIFDGTSFYEVSRSVN